LESYLYNLKHTLDAENGKISPADKKELSDLIDETLDWIEAQPEADSGAIEEKHKEIEALANPVMRELYSNGEPETEDMDFGDDEL